MKNKKSKIKIHVTQEDIDGASCGFKDCPISRAIKRQLECNVVHTFPYSGIMFNGKTYLPSDRTIAFIHKFDRKEKVKPFSFILGRTL